MTAESESPIAIACVPDAIPPTERAAHFALAAKLFRELARERKDLPDGYAIRFETDAFELVARFVVNERKCCPFMTFELSVARDPGTVW